jgi:hypothetical protein
MDLSDRQVAELEVNRRWDGIRVPDDVDELHHDRRRPSDEADKFSASEGRYQTIGRAQRSKLGGRRVGEEVAAAGMNERHPSGHTQWRIGIAGTR